jgi:hypothetical protein
MKVTYKQRNSAAHVQSHPWPTHFVRVESLSTLLFLRCFVDTPLHMVVCIAWQEDITTRFMVTFLMHLTLDLEFMLSAVRLHLIVTGVYTAVAILIPI